MRILLSVCILIGLTACENLLVAASEMKLEKVTLDMKQSQGEAIDSTLHLTSKGEWDWLRLGFMNKFYLIPVEDQYSSFDARLVFPKFTEDLTYNLGYSWNDKYKIYSAGVNYGCKPLKKLELDCAYKVEQRNPERITGSPYYLSNEMFGLIYESKPWGYSFKLACNDKDYPKDHQFTSVKLKLNQGINWEPLAIFGLHLDYQEETGVYRFSNSKNYWKEKWTLQEEQDFYGKWQYSCEYSKLNWERSFEPYRADQQIKLKMQSELNSVTKASFQAVYTDLDYYSETQEDYEPGVYYQLEKDLKSRVESKIGVEFQFDFTPYSVELGLYLGDFDYKSPSVADTGRSGIYSSITWKRRQVEVSFKIAPEGDLQHRDGFYELKVEYKL